LVISARKGEFETGFNRGGQTREHTLLTKTLGVSRIIVVMNKMDDPTVEWSKERYDEIVDQLTPFLKQVGFNVKTDVTFVPVSGIKGTNIKDPLSKEICPWFEGPTLLQALDQLKAVNRLLDFPLRIPVIDKFKDRGLVGALGKIEAGMLFKGQQFAIYPNKTIAEVAGIISDETRSVKKAGPGENVRVLFKGIDEEALNRGFIICDPKRPVACQAKFEAQVVILELLQHKSIFSAGYNAIIHIHAAVEECTVTVLLEQLDKKTGKSIQKKPKFVKNGGVVRCIIECAQPICLELFSDVPQLGRFTLRDEGKTIAIGKVTALGPRKKAENKNI